MTSVPVRRQPCEETQGERHVEAETRGKQLRARNVRDRRQPPQQEEGPSAQGFTGQGPGTPASAAERAPVVPGPQSVGFVRGICRGSPGKLTQVARRAQSVSHGCPSLANLSGADLLREHCPAPRESTQPSSDVGLTAFTRHVISLILEIWAPFAGKLSSKTICSSSELQQRGWKWVPLLSAPPAERGKHSGRRGHSLLSISFPGLAFSLGLGPSGCHHHETMRHLCGFS